jgi:hypothetical protein
MPTDWRMRYDSALGQHDPAKVSDACDLARRAINDCVLELATIAATDPERLELEEALREILMHELRVLRGNKDQA